VQTDHLAALQRFCIAVQSPVFGELSDPDQGAAAWIAQVNEQHRRFERPVLGAEGALELKLATALWRRGVLRALLDSAGPLKGAAPGRLLESLLALNVYLDADQRRKAEALLDPEQFARLRASMGNTPEGYPALAQVSGPGVALDIVANRSSRWTFEKWRLNERFSRYEPAGEGVRYRGVEFQPGDVLLANVNLDGNGVYTALSDPKSFSSHSAFFAVFQHRGARFPVVIETFEKGVRPVPLSVFLGPRFCSYVEVYRHQEYTRERADGLNAAAARFVDEVRGYNFDSEDRDLDYMSCTAVGRFMHQAAGMTPIRTQSKIGHPNIQANLGKLGYTFFDFFSPVDFLLSDRFRCVGCVDNNQVDRLLARELVDREFRRQFESRQLDPRRFPFRSRINRWGIRQIRSGGPAGSFLGWLEGFEARNLPKGPDDLMAVITPAEKQIGAVIKRATAAIARVLTHSTQPDLEGLLHHAEINDLVRKSLDLPWLPARSSQ
jgi:hypothetical protein